MSDTSNKAQGPGSEVNPDDAAEPQDFEVDSGCDTLIKAEEIKANPRVMAAIHKKLALKHRHIASIQDLKDASAEMDKEDYDS